MVRVPSAWGQVVGMEGEGALMAGSLGLGPQPRMLGSGVSRLTGYCLRGALYLSCNSCRRPCDTIQGLQEACLLAVLRSQKDSQSSKGHCQLDVHRQAGRKAYQSRMHHRWYEIFCPAKMFVLP